MTTDSSSDGDAAGGSDATPANHRYYFDTGVGYWTGTFTFEVTDWDGFRAADLGVLNRLLVVAMALAMRVVGEAKITSLLEPYPDAEPAGVVTNEVRVTVWGITLYLLEEKYVMHPDGTGVTVVSTERFGPIPHVLRSRKAHPAEVVDGGARAVYYMPLLGTHWVGRYRVKEDGDRIESVLTCDWAEATETIERVG